MEKYIHLVLGVLCAVGAVAIAVYGLYIDKPHALGESAVYAVIALILFHFYNEVKEKENNGI